MNFDEAKDAQDTRYDDVPVPEWGEGRTVRVGSLNALDMLEWLERGNDDKGGMRLAAKCWINDDGSRIPKEAQSAAVEVLAGKDSAVVGRIVTACLVLNGLRKKRSEAKNESSEAKSGASPIA